jgi:hypothetical protein
MFGFAVFKVVVKEFRVGVDNNLEDNMIVPRSTLGVRR